MDRISVGDGWADGRKPELETGIGVSDETYNQREGMSQCLKAQKPASINTNEWTKHPES